MHTKTWFVIINPEAGSGKGYRDWPKINKALKNEGITFDFVLTERRYHAVELAVSAVKSGYRRIVSVGGDGTLNEIVNGVFIQKFVEPKEVTLAVIGVGTGNDWQRTHNIPCDYREMVRIISEGVAQLLDVGKVSYFESRVSQSRYFINAAGIGFDAEVALATNRLKERGQKGRSLYFLCLMRTALKYKATSILLRVNEQEVGGRLYSITLGIGKYNGGGMMLAPNAKPNDGLFDLTIVKRASRYKLFRQFKRLYNGSILESPYVLEKRGSMVTVSSKPAVKLEVDGESLGSSPFIFTILPKNIRMVVGTKKIQ